MSTKKTLTKKDEQKPEEKQKSFRTPRDFVLKTTYADIYAQKNKIANQNVKAPKKPLSTSPTSNVSPMKGLLKSTDSTSTLTRSVRRSPSGATHVARTMPGISPSNVAKTPRTATSAKSVAKVASKLKTPTLEDKVKHVEKLSSKKAVNVNSKVKESKPDVARKLPFTNVTVNSPVLKKKEVNNLKPKTPSLDSERPRTKTRTLDESEVKILTPQTVDNNTEMLNLTKKLTAQPKAFFIDIEENKEPTTNKPSDDEVSYEDDFESYESDFDSYHSEATEASGNSEESEASGKIETYESKQEISLKEKDEERMLDSGSFDLRDRSAKIKPAVMDFIREDDEDKRVSLTDEGFQEMSSSSAVSSIRTVEVLDRPLFIDFSTSKRNRMKRKISERLKQRANDLLSMITLHEMSYSLFEMQPISYDLYMATFGRNNYTQVGVQTFEDGITEEVQTDEIVAAQKWTQHPVEFTKNIIESCRKERKYSQNTEDYLTKFTFLVEQSVDDQNEERTVADEDYKLNPLRIYFEQKDGVGDGMLLYESYKIKLKNIDYNAEKLSKFLKKRESRINHILTLNTGEKELTDLNKTSKLPFSKGFISIAPKIIQSEKYTFLNSSHIVRIFISDTKSNLILTVHKKAKFIEERKSLICLWDVSVAREPLKILIAIDNIIIGRFRGNTDGIFAAALDDGSIHLWDLTEIPMFTGDVASEEKPKELLEISNLKGLTQTEKDREWNLKNSNIGLAQHSIDMPLQSCAFTNSAVNMNDQVDVITGLEVISDNSSSDAGRRIIGQIVSLQRIGIIALWSIIQDKKVAPDIGKAFWSKMKLEKYQTINLTEHIDVTMKENNQNNSLTQQFNLNAAKRRTAMRKQDTKIVSRPKTARSQMSFDFDIDRPSSAASLRKKVLPVEMNFPKSWENGVVCNDLKVLMFNNVNCFLVGKNCGEVLCCKRCLGVVRVERFCVTTDTSSVTNIEVYPTLAQFLAATNNGTINICSLLDNRVLLTLDCRNLPPSMDLQDTYQSDAKGRFISSKSTVQVSKMEHNLFEKIIIKSIHWPRANPCIIHILLQNGTLKTFELTYSDIYTRHSSDKVAIDCATGDNTLALLTNDGEVQIHRLADENQTKEYLFIFEKYVSLL